MINNFEIIGKFKYLCEVDNKHKKIFLSINNKENKECYLMEIEILNELINIVKRIKENQLIYVRGHIETELCKVENEITFIDKLLIADKLIFKD